MTNDNNSVYIIRRSFGLLVLRLVFLELLLEFVYVVWRFGTSSLPLPVEIKSILELSANGAFIIVTLTQIVVLLILVAKWMNEYYEVRDTELIQWTGIINKKENTYPFTGIQSYTVRQSLIARLIKYGTVSLYIPALGRDLDFTEVPSPYAFIELIKQHLPTGDKERFLFRRR